MVRGCGVRHVRWIASTVPLPLSLPTLTRRALADAGTLNVLGACDRDFGVRRVVITSSSSAVYNGAPMPASYTCVGGYVAEVGAVGQRTSLTPLFMPRVCNAWWWLCVCSVQVHGEGLE